MEEFIKSISELFTKCFRHLIPGFFGLLAVLLFIDYFLGYLIFTSLIENGFYFLNMISIEAYIFVILPTLLILMYTIGLFFDGFFHTVIEVPIILNIIEKIQDRKKEKWNLDAWGYKKNDKEIMVFKELVNDFYYYGEGFTKAAIIFIVFTIYFFVFDLKLTFIDLQRIKYLFLILSVTLMVGFFVFGFKYIYEFYANFNSIIVKGGKNASEKENREEESSKEEDRKEEDR
jgi:hypothetical protein